MGEERYKYHRAFTDEMEFVWKIRELHKDKQSAARIWCHWEVERIEWIIHNLLNWWTQYTEKKK